MSTTPPIVAIQTTLTEVRDALAGMHIDELLTEKASAVLQELARQEHCLTGIHRAMEQLREELHSTAHAPPASRAHRQLTEYAYGLATGIILLSFVWFAVPRGDTKATEVFTRIDRVLVQQWTAVPPDMQQPLIAVYASMELPDPGKRQTRIEKGNK